MAGGRSTPTALPSSLPFPTASTSPPAAGTTAGRRGINDCYTQEVVEFWNLGAAEVASRCLDDDFP